MRYGAIVLALLLSTSAVAQQQPDPAFLQAAVKALQDQRNAALDGAAAAEAKMQLLQARIAELEKLMATPTLPPPAPPVASPAAPKR